MQRHWPVFISVMKSDWDWVGAELSTACPGVAQGTPGRSVTSWETAVAGLAETSQRSQRPSRVHRGDKSACFDGKDKLSRCSGHVGFPKAKLVNRPTSHGDWQSRHQSESEACKAIDNRIIADRHSSTRDRFPSPDSFIHVPRIFAHHRYLRNAMTLIFASHTG